MALEIRDYVYEPMGLKLAAKTYYHPDFLVVYENRIIEIHEIKAGYKNKKGVIVPLYKDDAIVKLKVAANKFPWFKFIMFYYYKGTAYEKEIPSD